MRHGGGVCADAAAPETAERAHADLNLATYSALVCDGAAAFAAAEHAVSLAEGAAFLKGGIQHSCLVMVFATVTTPLALQVAIRISKRRKMLAT